MKIEIWYEGSYHSNHANSGWSLKINDQIINSDKWRKEKLIKVITTFIESIEED